MKSITAEGTKPKIPNNPFAQRMARLLKYGTVEFEQKVGELIKTIDERFGKKLSEYTVKSWLNTSQAKLPQQKNLEMIASIFGYKDPFEMLAPEKESDQVRVGQNLIASLEEVLKQSLPLFGGRYINMDELPEEKRDLIFNILRITTQDSLHTAKTGIKIAIEAEESALKEKRDKGESGQVT